MSDVVERAKAALEGITEGPWEHRVGPEDETPAEYFNGTLINSGEPLHVLIAPSAEPQFAYVVPAITGDGPGSARNAEFIAQARTLVPELVAEVERLRDDLDFYSEWSNDLTQHIPEEFDDDIAQEAIISHWASSISSEVQRLREQIRQMRRQTELFMEDGDRNRLTVALAVSDE